MAAAVRAAAGVPVQLWLMGASLDSDRRGDCSGARVSVTPMWPLPLLSGGVCGGATRGEPGVAWRGWAMAPGLRDGCWVPRAGVHVGADGQCLGE